MIGSVARRGLSFLGLRRGGARATAPQWSHRSAQQYEAAHVLAWIGSDAGEHVERLRRKVATPHPLLLAQFFQNDHDVWREFAEHIRGKTVLDVGCGPIPFVSFLPSEALAIAIDPLINTYDAEMRRVHGISPFANVRPYAQPAEVFIPELEGRVDGAIFCRNALDHLEFPAIVLSNLAGYAAPGCRLLLWTDVVHDKGGDAGHHSIANDVASFARLVRNLGFDVERLTPAAPNRSALEWGCVAVKR